MPEELTIEAYITDLNRFSNTEIARVFKVSEAAVEGWKNGENIPAEAWYRGTLSRILNERGTAA
jgi:hypothetical protein